MVMDIVIGTLVIKNLGWEVTCSAFLAPAPAGQMIQVDQLMMNTSRYSGHEAPEFTRKA